eukprot:8801512-Pyramimonas_sp.AAC.1
MMNLRIMWHAVATKLSDSAQAANASIRPRQSRIVHRTSCVHLRGPLHETDAAGIDASPPPRRKRGPNVKRRPNGG